MSTTGREQHGVQGEYRLLWIKFQERFMAWAKFPISPMMKKKTGLWYKKTMMYGKWKRCCMIVLPRTTNNQMTLTIVLAIHFDKGVTRNQGVRRSVLLLLTKTTER